MPQWAKIHYVQFLNFVPLHCIFTAIFKMLHNYLVKIEVQRNKNPYSERISPPLCHLVILVFSLLHSNLGDLNWRMQLLKGICFLGNTCWCMYSAKVLINQGLLKLSLDKPTDQVLTTKSVHHKNLRYTIHLL